MVAVGHLVDRRMLGVGFVTTLGVVVLLTVAANPTSASAAPNACGTPGADGPQPTLGGNVNAYFPGTSASVAAGATSLTVGASIGASTPIAVGDKVLIIQMQSAALDSTNTDAYGDGVVGEPPSGATNWASAGTYELAVAANSVSSAGGTLQLLVGTLNAYASSAATATMGQQTFQVVRVPQYSSATLGSNVTATAWNGGTGGIVVLDIAGTLDLNGFRIDVSGSGFRGGAGRPLAGGAGGANTDVRTSASNAFDGGKAEGVAGTPRYVFGGVSTTDTGLEGYPNGSFARGAPANAGGGGTDGHPSANDQNSGGGGGANGGAGGQGGNSWSSNLAVGGAGGGAVPTPSITHVVLGGGGGAGTRNNAGPSDGGVGAGLVMLDIGSLAGTGEIRANGGNGQTAANDGGGGGGAGGSVVVVAASGTLSGLTVNANGGGGGNAWPAQAPGGYPGERHGPGGGGSGGVILFSVTGATTSTSGGTHGITTSASDAYNATDGSGGTTSTFAGSFPGAGNASTCGQQPAAAPSADLSLTKTTTSPAATSGDQIGYALAAHNNGPDSAADVAITDTLPAGLTFVSATGDGWACANAGAVVTCTRAQLASGATATVMLVVTAARGATITNSATVTSRTADPNAANGVASAAVRVASGADLMVSKTASAATFTPGKRLTFTIVVGNAGSDDVLGAQVRDLVPATLNGFDWACSAVLGQCADLAGVGSIVQTVDIRAGGRVTYRLSGLVTQRNVTTIANRVTVSAPPDVVDTDPANNVAAARVRLAIVPTRLSVTIAPGFTIVASGEPTRFVVRTTDTGTGVAKSVVTCITIPMGASVTRASGGIVGNGHYCWRAASLPPGKTVQYVVSILADRRQAQHLALVASAGARNAPSTHARARVNVLAEVKKMTGGYTG